MGLTPLEKKDHQQLIFLALFFPKTTAKKFSIFDQNHELTPLEEF